MIHFRMQIIREQNNREQGGDPPPAVRTGVTVASVGRTVGSPLHCREPVAADAVAICALVGRCGVLDPNSTYCYLLLATHFAATCAVAVRAGRIVGFVSGYLVPSEPSTLFIWQIAVDPATRGQGVARRLLAAILGRRACRAVRYLEATVTPSNTASRALFSALARDRGASLERRPRFTSADLGGTHEPEHLVRIGPFGPAGTPGVRNP